MNLLSLMTKLLTRKQAQADKPKGHTKPKRAKAHRRVRRQMARASRKRNRVA